MDRLVTDPLASCWAPWEDQASWIADHATPDTPEEAASRLRLAEACARLRLELLDTARGADGIDACMFCILMSRVVASLPNLPPEVVMRLARAGSLAVL